VVDLYIAPIRWGLMDGVYPPRRQAQLEAIKEETHRRQRWAVWKLLEQGLFQSLGLAMEQVEFSLDDRGYWFCKECFFSLSHSKHAVAVAISDAPVGVDIEVLDRPLHPGLPKKILTPGGQAEFAALEEIRKQPYLLQKWCEKESLFKWREAAKKSVILRSRKATKNPQHLPCRAIDGGPSLQAAQDDRNFCHTGTVTVAGEVYCYAVATQDDTVELKILNAE